MINWNSITHDDIIVLANIAGSHAMGISDMLRNLDQLDEGQRETVNQIVEKHAEGQTDRAADTLYYKRDLFNE